MAMGSWIGQPQQPRRGICAAKSAIVRPGMRSTHSSSCLQCSEVKRRGDADPLRSEIRRLAKVQSIFHHRRRTGKGLNAHYQSKTIEQHVNLTLLAQGSHALKMQSPADARRGEVHESEDPDDARYAQQRQEKAGNRRADESAHAGAEVHDRHRSTARLRASLAMIAPMGTNPARAAP